MIENGGIFGQDRDAAFALELVGIHDPLGEGLIGAKGASLAQELIDEGGFAVIDVGDDSDVANGAHRVFLIPGAAVRDPERAPGRARF